MQRPRRRPRTLDHQLDLFLAGAPPSPGSVPGRLIVWSALPERTRHAVIGLMTSLLIAHAGDAVPRPGSDDDER